MQYFTEQAASHREAMDKIKLKYGDNARILTHRNIRVGGFLGMFAKDGIEVSGYVAQDSGRIRRKDLEEEKQKILNSVKGDKTLDAVLKEVRSLKDQLADGIPQVQEKHESIRKIEELLQTNEFSFSFIEMIGERLRKELSIEDLDNYAFVQDSVLEWIGESISIYQDSEKPVRGPKIMILVGPTGVGKTTTIAKLAAINGLGQKGESPRAVRMITIDSYRIGAKKQIETYGDIMGIPVCGVESYEDLQKKVALYQDVDLILIDTIGKSPKDFMKLAEMREMLEACGNQSEVLLALSATTKISDIKEILQQFEPFRYSGIVLTKLDETMRVGNIISVVAENRKPLAFITDGQNVPNDIERAGVMRFLMTLEGFQVNRAHLTKKFAHLQPGGDLPGTRRSNDQNRFEKNSLTN